MNGNTVNENSIKQEIDWLVEILKCQSKDDYKKHIKYLLKKLEDK